MDLRLLRHLAFPPLAGKVDVVYGDLMGDISGLCEDCDYVLHAAARTFVDMSILDPGPFVESNVIATYRLLEDARRYKVKRFIQMSTDECLGSILEGAHKEDATYKPSNPYSATKAGAECLAMSYANTFGMHTVIPRAENLYGPYQHVQKVFPVFTKKALQGEALPVYGDGKHVRQWLWVDDMVDALWMLLSHKDVERGGIYHVAGNQELENIVLAKKILTSLGLSEEQIKYVPDHDIRPGHDRRYALDSSKMRELGWSPSVEVDEGIRRATGWYKAHQQMWY
jgi:dTDP-glucose 4,6-dehydratase